jgi:hypothetical protein
MPFEEIQIGNARIRDTGDKIVIILESPYQKLSDIIQFLRSDDLSYGLQYENITVENGSVRSYEMGTIFNPRAHMYLRFAKDVTDLNSPSSTNIHAHSFVESGITKSMEHLESNDKFMTLLHTVPVEVVNTLLRKYDQEFNGQEGGKRHRSRQTRRRGIKRRQTRRRT